MQASLKQKIVAVIDEQIGIETALAVYAALEIAEQNFSQFEVIKYGDLTAELIRQRS